MRCDHESRIRRISANETESTLQRASRRLARRVRWRNPIQDSNVRFDPHLGFWSRPVEYRECMGSDRCRLAITLQHKAYGLADDANRNGLMTPRLKSGRNTACPIGAAFHLTRIAIFWKCPANAALVVMTTGEPTVLACWLKLRRSVKAGQPHRATACGSRRVRRHAFCRFDNRS